MNEYDFSRGGVEKYFRLIEHDLKLLDLLTEKYPSHLEKEDFSDWIVTTLFYIACIYLKALFRLYGEDIQIHYALKQQLYARKELFQIIKPYRHLEEASRDARYEGRVFSSDYIINRLYPKFKIVRDCVVELFNKNRIFNIPQVDPLPFLKRLKERAIS